jgi:hypothetical protein
VKNVAMICLFLMPLVAGCSHPLTVVNRSTYADTDIVPYEKKITVGIVPMSSDDTARHWVRGIGDALMRSGSVHNVTLPYYEGGKQQVDLVARIDIRSDYSGSGWNFLITWPGFLIFTPAWNGFVYKADLNTRVTLYDGRSNKQIDYLDIPIKYDIRHADINRTWCEVGWLEVSLIPFVCGFFYVQYDDSVTQKLVEQMSNDYGNYIAGRILKSRAREYSYSRASAE